MLQCNELTIKFQMIVYAVPLYRQIYLLSESLFKETLKVLITLLCVILYTKCFWLLEIFFLPFDFVLGRFKLESPSRVVPEQKVAYPVGVRTWPQC